MKVYSLFAFLIFSVTTISLAQDSTINQNSLSSGTLSSQFDYIYRVSNGFQEYEVVKKSNLEQLKANVLDSVRTLSEQTSELKVQMKSLNDSVDLVKNLIAAETEAKNLAIADRDNFVFLGMGIQKSVYSSIMWALVVILSGALAFFAVQYFRSFGRIKKAEQDFLEVQEELETHRKKTLDRERKLKRELVDAQQGRHY